MKLKVRILALCFLAALVSSLSAQVLGDHTRAQCVPGPAAPWLYDLATPGVYYDCTAQNTYTARGGGGETLTFSAPLVRTLDNVACTVATGSVPGCISAASWTAFNAKQPPGSYLTALTGDVVAAGPGSSAAVIQALRVTNAMLAGSIDPAKLIGGTFGAGDYVFPANVIAGPTSLRASDGAFLSTDISTPSNPSAGTTLFYAKGGKWCSLSPSGSENCTGTSGSPAFSDITGATNNSAAMVIGTGASLGVSGSGSIDASLLGGSAAALYAKLAGPTFTGTVTVGTSVLDAATSGIAAGGLISGTNLNIFTAFSGPGTSLKTFALPNASATILTSNAAVTVAQGGTGIASGTSGGIPYYSGSTSFASSAAGTAGHVVLWGGAGSAPTDGGVPATGTVTTVGFTGGLISVANPTTAPAFTVAGTSGGIPYFASASTWASSAAWTVNTLMKGGGAGATPTVSGITVDASNNMSVPGSVTSGSGGGATGAFDLSGATSGIVTIQPQAIAGTYNFNVPTAAGSSGNLLTSAGGGSSPMTWTATNGSGNVLLSAGTAAIASGKTLTVSNSYTTTATDGSTVAFGAGGTVPYLGANNIFTANGALSSGAGPGFTANGTWITSGSATTTKPYFLIETTGTTSTGWSTFGTGLGINGASGFVGKLIDTQVAGSSVFSVSGFGNITANSIATGATSTMALINSTSAATSLNLQATSTSAANLFSVTLAAGTLSQTSGTNGAVRITPTYNQASGTAANTDLLVNRTQTAIGSGAQNLADFQVGGVSKWSVSNVGLVTMVGSSFVLNGKTCTESGGAIACI